MAVAVLMNQSCRMLSQVGIVTPRNELAPMCPRDFKYLPRIPRKQAIEEA